MHKKDNIMTEKEIRERIFQSIPDITYSEMLKLRDALIYKNIPLEVLTEVYKRHIQVENWNKSKNKNYYRVRMLNGGYKYVYMCEDMVKDFYSNYELVK